MNQNPFINIQKSFRNLGRHQVALHREHLTRRGRDEAVDLASVLVNLAAVEHGVQAAGLLGQLEEPLPFILGKRGLLERCPGGVLGLALGLPGGDLGLLSGEGALVVLVVAGLGVVGLDAVEEEIAVLLEEGVDAEGEVVIVGGQDRLLGECRGLQGRERGGDVSRGRLGLVLKLVEEGGDQVGVVNLDWELDQNVLVLQAGLLQPNLSV